MYISKENQLVSNIFDNNIFEYIDAISFIPVQRDAIVNLAKELIKYRIRRELTETLNDAQGYLKSCGEDKIEDIVSKVDSIYSKHLFHPVTI